MTVPRTLLTACIAVIILLILCRANAHASSPSRPVVIGYSSKAFFEVDPRDALGLTKVWVQTVDRSIGAGQPSSVVLYRSLDDMERALRTNEVDIVVLIAEDFLLLRDKIALAPVLSADFGRHFYDVLQILVRADSGITRLEQLRGKAIHIESGQKGDLPCKWLDVFLAARRETPGRDFFSSITRVAKASQAVMPLFFGKTDACLTSRDSLETMLELNPQLGRSLRVLETSPGFITGIVAVRRDVINPQRDAMLDAIKTMHQDVKGRQLLTVFRINRLIDFKPEHLVSADKVFRNQNSAAARPGKKR